MQGQYKKQLKKWNLKQLPSQYHKHIKYLGINLIVNIQNLYIENLKTILREFVKNK